MQISSPAFSPNDPIPQKYTCDGENVSPPMQFTDVPEEAESLALIMHDPDAPMGDWLHWTVWNVPGNTNQFSEGSIPAGAVTGINDFKKLGYGGPCPPPRALHHYRFELYALDSVLDIPTESTMADIKTVMQGHIIDKAELTGTYERQ